jgi:hypothetical protein
MDDEVGRQTKRREVSPSLSQVIGETNETADQ